MPFPSHVFGTHLAVQGDCLEVMREIPDDFFDLVICSPPYEDARTYGIDFNLKGQEWVDWAVERYVECVRVCRGLVVWVVEGKTRQFKWSATPALLMADLHRKGVKLRKPPIFHRVGIPGSGGPDWWRNDYEFCVASSKGKLPWSNNTATGSPPKYGCFGGSVPPGYSSGDVAHVKPLKAGGPFSNRTTSGDRVQRFQKEYEISNPGNVIKCNVGGGKMGSNIAHENEAPFPEALVEPFVRSFCPPNGLVLDCFGGSGTTASVAELWGRRSVSIDVRASQIELIERRIAEARTRPKPSSSPAPEPPPLA